MKFCKDCGKTLNILQDALGEECTTCARKNSKQEARPAPTNPNPPVPVEATLHIRDDKIILESKEGWLLWSGDTTNKHNLGTILERASRILTIRKRKTKR